MSTPSLRSRPAEQLENFTGAVRDAFAVGIDALYLRRCLLLEFRRPFTAPGQVQL